MSPIDLKVRKPPKRYEDPLDRATRRLIMAAHNYIIIGKKSDKKLEELKEAARGLATMELWTKYQALLQQAERRALRASKLARGRAKK
jgi:hypothetical protein